MLFNIYTKPLDKFVRVFGMSSLQYTDDSQLCLMLPDHKEAVETLEWYLEVVMV